MQWESALDQLPLLGAGSLPVKCVSAGEGPGGTERLQCSHRVIPWCRNSDLNDI